MKLDRTVIAVAVPVALAFGGGLIEMRVAIAQLQSQVASVEQRVERIETYMDARARVSRLEHPR